MSRKIVKSKFFFEQDYVENVAEVSTDKIEQWAANDKLKIVGKPISRIDGYDKVSGTAVFTFDKKLPGMVFAKILHSPFPNAKIKNIKTAKAEALHGVMAILTYKNAPDIPWYYGTTKLFDQHVRYNGDEVACVTAESEQAADEAIRLIEVEYEELPFVIDAEKAMKENAPKVHESGNILGGKPETYERGNIEDGFKNADAVVEDVFTTQCVIHNPTEVHCSVVNWDGDKLTIWDSTQGVFTVRSAIASSLNLPESNVRVIKKYMGGGFGSKLEAGKYTVMAALAARKLGRPVKITLDRKQMNLSVGNRPDSYQKLKAGAKKDGTLTALNHYSYGSVGAYPNGAGCSWPLRTLYKCPNIKTEEYNVYINAGRARAYRAPGNVQGTFALDSLIDELAEKIGMDPLDFRIKNLAEIDQVSKLPYTSKKLKEAYTQGAKEIGWYEKRKPAGSDKGIIKRGMGVASQIWWGGGGPPSYATLKLNADGSVNIISGTQDIGTGTYTIIAQVVSEVLEIPIDKIQVTVGDTAVAPYSGSSGGSTTAASVSPAVRDAAEQMKQKLISGAAALLELPENNLLYKEGKVITKDNSKNISIHDIVRKTHERVLITTGARNANPEGYAINTFGAQFAEVEVDTYTGKVTVIKIVAAHDIGRVLNPQTMGNQMHGGIIQGLGYALLEERLIDRNTGKILNPNMHDYKMATIKDVPEIKIIITSNYDSMISSTGVKGVGEPAIIPTAGAIANAVYNALGIRIKSLPISPDKVINTLYKA